MKNFDTDCITCDYCGKEITFEEMVYQGEDWASKDGFDCCLKCNLKGGGNCLDEDA